MKSFATIAEALGQIAERFPDQTWTFQDMAGAETTYTNAEFVAQTARRAAGLQQLGLKKGERFGLVVIEPEDFVLTFLGAVRLGAVPIPLYPPMSFSSLDAYADRTARILTNAGARLLVASKRLENVLWGLVGQVPSLTRLARVEELDVDAEPTWEDVAPEDLCFLQYTSGSTSDPKGVMVTHGNLVANCDAIATHLELVPAEDVSVSWLPLYHDMGLIGMLITPLLHGVPSHYIPTVRFIRRPNCWLETMSRHRGTISFAPNFAYALATRRAKAAQLEAWDLSSVRALGCGAEPIHADTMRGFTQHFAAAGLAPNVILPAYGMAEATLAMSLKPVREGMVTHKVAKSRFEEEGVASPPQNEDDALEHVACGVTFPEHELAILDERGERVADGVQGEICFRGPSTTPGYLENPEATAEAFRGSWLHTGDLGYLHEGQVYVTGRLKDLIIFNGRNIHPQAVEWAVAEIEGVRKGNVVAFSVPGATSERLVAVLETRHEDPEALVEAVRQHVQRELTLVLDDVVCLEPGSLPKTSSGKLQRRKTRQQYLTGTLGTEGSRTAGSTAARVTLAKHVARSVWNRAKSAVLSR